jgi:hypothetical protein
VLAVEDEATGAEFGPGAVGVNVAEDLGAGEAIGAGVAGFGGLHAEGGGGGGHVGAADQGCAPRKGSPVLVLMGSSMRRGARRSPERGWLLAEARGCSRASRLILLSSSS